MQKLLAIICLFTWLLPALILQAQDSKAVLQTKKLQPQLTQQPTETTATPRNFDQSELDNLRQNANYHYHQKSEGSGWFSRLLKRLDRWLSKLSPSAKTGNTIFDIIQMLLWIGLVILVISLLLNTKISALFFTKPAPRQTIVPYDIVDENIHELNFDELIAQAAANKDYRRAIRYRYLKCLKNLTDRNIISWQPNKTNRDYLTELQFTAWHAPFEQVTQAFNYVWYGNFALTDTHFNHLWQTFEQFEATTTTIPQKP